MDIGIAVSIEIYFTRDLEPSTWSFKALKQNYKQYKRETSKLRAFTTSISWYLLVILFLAVLFVIKII